MPNYYSDSVEKKNSKNVNKDQIQKLTWTFSKLMFMRISISVLMRFTIHLRSFAKYSLGKTWGVPQTVDFLSVSFFSSKSANFKMEVVIIVAGDN